MSCWNTAQENVPFFNYDLTCFWVFHLTWDLVVCLFCLSLFPGYNLMSSIVEQNPCEVSAILKLSWCLWDKEANCKVCNWESQTTPSHADFYTGATQETPRSFSAGKTTKQSPDFYCELSGGRLESKIKWSQLNLAFRFSKGYNSAVVYRCLDLLCPGGAYFGGDAGAALGFLCGQGWGASSTSSLQQPVLRCINRWVGASECMHFNSIASRLGLHSVKLKWFSGLLAQQYLLLRWHK